MLAGGIMAMPLMSNAGYYQSVDDTIKVAVIGCGGRGTGAAMQALSTKQNVKLVAMADAFRDRLDNAYKALTDGDEGNVKDRVAVTEETKFVGFDGYKKAIPLADVVIIATPPGFRPIHFEEAINQDLSEQEDLVVFGGRLAEYRYYDMHQVIGSALVKSRRELEG